MLIKSPVSRPPEDKKPSGAQQHGVFLGELNADAQSLIEVSLSNVDRLTRLVNDILDLERIGSDQMRLSLETVGFDALVLNAIEANRPFAREFHTQIEWQPGTPRAQLRTDCDRATQIFTNLMSNAVKFSPQGSVITVKTRRHHDETGNWLRTEISDRGAGIPIEFQKRIFGKFTRADGSNTRTAQGTGLGLSIARAHRKAGRAHRLRHHARQRHHVLVRMARSPAGRHRHQRNGARRN